MTRATMAGLPLARLSPADAGEVLPLQRAAFVTEAQLHDDGYQPARTTPAGHYQLVHLAKPVHPQ